MLIIAAFMLGRVLGAYCARTEFHERYRFELLWGRFNSESRQINHKV